MELNDCAFPTLNKVIATDDAKVAFKDLNVGLLVGARPRGPGMERKDLLLANAQIFSAQGKALNEVADRNVKILVVGNPANTNALIARANAKDLNPRNFTAMTRLDQNRALSQLAEKTGSHVTAIKKMTIWGNHSATQYPDITTRPLPARPPVAGRPEVGARRRSFRSCSSVARPSSRRAASRPRLRPRPPRSTTCTTGCSARRTATGLSMAVPSDGSYGVQGRRSSTSYPVTCRNGEYQIVQGLSVDEFSRSRMDATEKELREERDGVKGPALRRRKPSSPGG